MKKIAVVITARPSYSRIRSVLTALMARADVDLQVICAASAVVTRFGKVSDIIKADGFPVVAEISSVVEEDSLANSALSTGLLLTQLAGTFERLKPDVVVTIADRHETIATAIAASYQNIKLCHLLGGEVSGSIDDKVRNAVTQLADVHCVATQQAADMILSMRDRGYRGAWSTIHVTGCPSIDLAAEAIRLGPMGDGRVIVVQHPVTTEADQAGEQMQVTVNALREFDPLYFWPGEDAGAQAMSKVLRMEGIKPVRNLSPVGFLRLLLGSSCLVGNSSVGIRECSFMGVPVVNIGNRQDGRERGPNVLDVPHHVEEIRHAVERFDGRLNFPKSTLYGDGHAGERIARILAEEA